MSEITKMTFKVHKPLWERFDEQISRMPVKRDPFLSSVLRRETPRLATAMAGKRLSGKANRWVSTQLNRLDRQGGIKPVNIGIDADVAADLKQVVTDSNMVRDAFFNRLIAFLRASDALLDFFELPRKVDGSVGSSYGSDLLMPASPLANLEDTFADPLWYLHMAAEEKHETCLYLLPFQSPDMDGFECWMDDANVPGTRHNKKARLELETLSWEENEFDLVAFGKRGQ